MGCGGHTSMCVCVCVCGCVCFQVYVCVCVFSKIPPITTLYNPVIVQPRGKLISYSLMKSLSLFTPLSHSFSSSAGQCLTEAPTIGRERDGLTRHALTTPSILPPDNSNTFLQSSSQAQLKKTILKSSTSTALTEVCYSGG